MNLVIRKAASPDDAAAVRALVSDAYLPYVERIGRPPAPMDDDYDELVAAGGVWLAEEAGELVGVIVLRTAEDHLVVENVAVRPGLQGKGTGTRLLDFADERASAAGLGEVRLYTNARMTENLVFYPRRGFVETHRRHDNGFDRVYFSKRI